MRARLAYQALEAILDANDTHAVFAYGSFHRRANHSVQSRRVAAARHYADGFIHKKDFVIYAERNFGNIYSRSNNTSNRTGTNIASSIRPYLIISDRLYPEGSSRKSITPNLNLAFEKGQNSSTPPAFLVVA